MEDVCLLFHHMNTQVTRDSWREAVRRQGLSLKTLARLTGTSERSIYAYSDGSRRPSDAWIARVADIVLQLEGIAS